MHGCRQELVRTAGGEKLDQFTAGVVDAGWKDRAKGLEEVQ